MLGTILWFGTWAAIIIFICGSIWEGTASFRLRHRKNRYD